MKREELILFPFIKHLAISNENNTKPTLPNFGTVNNPISMMENEHEKAGDIFMRIAK